VRRYKKCAQKARRIQKVRRYEKCAEKVRRKSAPYLMNASYSKSAPL